MTCVCGEINTRHCPVHGQGVGWLRLLGRRVYYHAFIGWRLWLLEHRG